MLHEKLKVNQIKPSIALENTKVTIMVSMGIYLLTFNLLQIIRLCPNNNSTLYIARVTKESHTLKMNKQYIVQNKLEDR